MQCGKFSKEFQGLKQDLSWVVKEQGQLLSNCDVTEDNEAVEMKAKKMPDPMNKNNICWLRTWCHEWEKWKCNDSILSKEKT